MKLKEIFQHLTFGELSQIDLGGTRIGEIAENNYERVARPISLGLTELHQRFLIREGSIVINTVPGLLTYVLDSTYAVSNTNSRAANKYLADSAADKFKDNVFKIERVYDVDGNELVLNDYDDPDSVVTPGYKTLMIPATLVSNTLRVVYRANHPILTEDDWSDPETCEVDLPPAFLGALLLYVGEKVMNPSGFSGGNGFHEGNNYAGKFEAACLLLENKNFSIDVGTGNKRAQRNGWV